MVIEFHLLRCEKNLFHFSSIVHFIDFFFLSQIYFWPYANNYMDVNSLYLNLLMKWTSQISMLLGNSSRVYKLNFQEWLNSIVEFEVHKTFKLTCKNRITIVALYLPTCLRILQLTSKWILKKKKNYIKHDINNLMNVYCHVYFVKK